MHIRSLILSVVAVAALTVACDKSEKTAPAGQGASVSAKPGEKNSTAPATPAAKGPSTIALGALGLKADAPEGASVEKGIGDGMMITGGGIVVSVEVASSTRPATLEAAKEDAAMYTPKNWKTEKLADGWAATFDNEGGMGKNYFVNVRRDIGGKTYWCETTSSTPDQQTGALAVCKSLKK